MKHNKPTVSTVVVSGYVPIDHVAGVTSYELTLVNKAGITAAGGTYAVPSASVAGSDLKASFALFTLNRGMEMQPGEYTVRVVAKSAGNEASDPGEQTFKISQDEADGLNRLFKKPFPWVRTVIATVVILGLCAIAYWVGSTGVQKTNEVAKAATTNTTTGVKQDTLAAQMVANNEAEIKALREEQLMIQKGLDDAISAHEKRVHALSTSTATNVPSGQTPASMDSKSPVSQTVNIPPNATIRVKNGNITAGGDNFGPIVGSTVILYPPQGGSGDRKSVVVIPDCRKTGWVGENNPTSMFTLPDGVLSGATNFVLKPGEKLMICAPANVTVHPDINDTPNFVIKYGDECGKQGDYQGQLAPGQVIPQIHGYLRILVEAKNEGKKKSGWFSDNKIFNFTWREKSPRTSTP